MPFTPLAALWDGLQYALETEFIRKSRAGGCLKPFSAINNKELIYAT
jgi:hypothetical protein